MKGCCVRHVSLPFVCCYLEFKKKQQKPSCTNWWLILEKCIETVPGRHQEALPIWPWLLQCIQCCQESKSVITATQCMKHPRSFAFYFLYSQSKASPAAGCSLRAHKAWATRRVRDGAPRASGSRCWDVPLWLQPPCPARGWSSHPSTASPLPAKATGTAQSWLLAETVLLKTQCQERRQPVISSDPATNHSLLRGSPMPTGHCRHRILCQMRIQKARSRKASWPESEMQNLMMDRSPSNEMNCQQH